MKSLKTDVVYVYKNLDDSEELKYSIRSVVKNWPHRQIWIIGDKPKWANEKLNVIAPLAERVYSRYWDVNNKLRLVCGDKRISNPFWFFNDDFFVLDKVDVEKYKTYYDGSLRDKEKALKIKYSMLKTWPYLQGFKEAEEIIRKNGGKSFKNFETHVPVLFEKEKLNKVINTFPKSACRRSIYMNLFYPDEGIEHKDVKKYGQTDMVEVDDILLSTDNNSFKGNVGNYIREKFDGKCKYER